MALSLSDIIDHTHPVDPVVMHVTSDSRTIKPGTLFVATHENAEHIMAAVQAGACAVLAQSPCPGVSEGIPYIIVDAPRQALSIAAARLYPGQPDTMVAVTGTNGKTSSAVFAQQIYALLGHKSVSIGTLGVRGAVHQDGQMTTPDAVTLHQLLSNLQAQGVTHGAMEASSHGLDQYRLHNVHIRAAGFTNLTHDHLDYHQTMDTYFAAKARLFTEVLAADGTAVINADSDYAPALLNLCKVRSIQTVTFGQAGQDITLLSRTPQADGQVLTLSAHGKQLDVFLPLAGIFHAMNALCAAGLVMATEGTEVWPDIVKALSSLVAAPGRLQYVGRNAQGAAIYVDYAHTPDALDVLLSSLRPHVSGCLHLVFGCGGDRDATKRPMMGAIAARLADTVIVTDDNPRTENPANIRQAILEKCPAAQNIGDRQQAIATAIASAKDGDVVVVAGKGHEQGQIIGTTTHPFDDVRIATMFLQEIKRVS